MYHSENIWPEIKSAIIHFISERRERHLDTLNAYLYDLIKRLIKSKNSLELISSEIWNQLKDELVGKLIPNRPLSYVTERYGVTSQSKVTKTLIEVFGAKKSKHHGNLNKLIFNKEKLERVGMTYEVSIDIVNGILGIDGDDSKFGMDKFVENHNTSATSTVTNVSTENASANNNEVSNLSPDDIVKPEDNSANGIDGDDGDDFRHGMDGYVNNVNENTSNENGSDNNNEVLNLSSADEIAKPKDSCINGIDGDDGCNTTDDHKIKGYDTSFFDKASCSLSSAYLYNTNSQLDESSLSHPNSKNQTRKATAATSAHSDSKDITHLSHLSHLSQTSQQSSISLTSELVEEFFYDDEGPYRPPPPHTLDESPCKSIIRLDNHTTLYN